MSEQTAGLHVYTESSRLHQDRGGCVTSVPSGVPLPCAPPECNVALGWRDVAEVGTKSTGGGGVVESAETRRERTMASSLASDMPRGCVRKALTASSGVGRSSGTATNQRCPCGRSSRCAFSSPARILRRSWSGERPSRRLASESGRYVVLGMWYLAPPHPPGTGYQLSRHVAASVMSIGWLRGRLANYRTKDETVSAPKRATCPTCAGPVSHPSRFDNDSYRTLSCRRSALTTPARRATMLRSVVRRLHRR